MIHFHISQCLRSLIYYRDSDANGNTSTLKDFEDKFNFYSGSRPWDQFIKDSGNHSFLMSTPEDFTIQQFKQIYPEFFI